MAISDAYATAEEYRWVIEKTDSGDDADILKDLKSISRYIEGKLERFFNKDMSAVERFFDVPENAGFIRVNDMAESPESIYIDDDGDGVCEEKITEYELYPLNAAVGPEARPYSRVVLQSWHERSRFYKGQRVAIKDKWGWPAVPDAVSRACIHLTAILRLETPRATRRVPELGEVVETSTDAQRNIQRLMDNYQIVGYL